VNGISEVLISAEMLDALRDFDAADKKHVGLSWRRKNKGRKPRRKLVAQLRKSGVRGADFNYASSDHSANHAFTR
jgi:hypothetical protein